MNKKIKKVAHLGLEGSFSSIAAKKYFGEGNVIWIPTANIEKVFDIVCKDSPVYGVIPIENSTSGSIMETYERLQRNNVLIVGEVFMKIHHNILAKENTALKNMVQCFSHPQALLQCRTLLSKYPSMKLVFTEDTASAAKLVSESNDSKMCAIAGSQAAKIYGLKVLKENIVDNVANYTRFAVISKKESKEGNKISIVFSVAHVPGSLNRILTEFAKIGCNLTKIESRPLVGTPWEYIFFIDLEFVCPLIVLNGILRGLKKQTRFIHLLGIYKKGETYEA